MQFTRYTDYALRVMIYVGTRDDGRLSSINEVAKNYDISKNHLMKVVQALGRAGFVETLRGRTGGLRLGRPAAEISIGEVVRHTENDRDLVDCSTCLIAPVCALPRILNEAKCAFLAVLDRHTLADLLTHEDDLKWLFSYLSPGRQRSLIGRPPPVNHV